MIRTIVSSLLITMSVATFAVAQMDEPVAPVAPVAPAAPVTPAGPASPEEVEITAVREAGKGFATAVLGDSFDLVSMWFAGTKEDLELMRTLHEAYKAHKAASAAIDKKFPRPADDKSQRPFSADVESARKQMDVAEVKITGQTATIENAFELRKTAGKWRVTGVPAAEKPEISKFAPALAKASKDLVADLAKDKFKSREEAEEALDEAIVHGLKETHTREATTQPATGPAPAGRTTEGVGRDMQK